MRLRHLHSFAADRRATVPTTKTLSYAASREKKTSAYDFSFGCQLLGYVAVCPSVSYNDSYKMELQNFIRGSFFLFFLSCLRSPTFRHMHIVTRVSQDITASVLFFVILNVIGASFFLIECASLHRYLELNGFSAPILLFQKWTSRSLTRSSAEDFYRF